MKKHLLECDFEVRVLSIGHFRTFAIASADLTPRAFGHPSPVLSKYFSWILSSSLFEMTFAIWFEVLMAAEGRWVGAE